METAPLEAISNPLLTRPTMILILQSFHNLNVSQAFILLSVIFPLLAFSSSKVSTFLSFIVEFQAPFLRYYNGPFHIFSKNSPNVSELGFFQIEEAL